MTIFICSSKYVTVFWILVAEVLSKFFLRYKTELVPTNKYYQVFLEWLWFMGCRVSAKSATRSFAEWRCIKILESGIRLQSSKRMISVVYLPPASLRTELIVLHFHSADAFGAGSERYKHNGNLDGTLPFRKAERASGYSIFCRIALYHREWLVGLPGRFNRWFKAFFQKRGGFKTSWRLRSLLPLLSHILRRTPLKMASASSDTATAGLARSYMKYRSLARASEKFYQIIFELSVVVIFFSTSYFLSWSRQEQLLNAFYHTEPLRGKF